MIARCSLCGVQMRLQTPRRGLLGVGAGGAGWVDGDYVARVTRAADLKWEHSCGMLGVRRLPTCSLDC